MWRVRSSQVMGKISDIPVTSAMCAFAAICDNTIALLRNSAGASGAPRQVRVGGPLDVNGRVQITSVLVINETVKDGQQVWHTCCSCADRCPMNGVAAPPKRDARTLEVPEGACKLTRVAIRPLVDALVVGP